MQKQQEWAAEKLGSIPNQVLLELREARELLTHEWRVRFSEARFDAENRRLVSRDRRYALQWKLRRCPDMPDSYENQQTNRGIVVVERLQEIDHKGEGDD